MAKEDNHIDFDNEVSANQFKVTIWRTTQKSESSTQKKPLKDSNTIQKDSNTIQKSDTTTQKSEIATQKESLKDISTTQKDECATQKSESTTQKDLDATQKKVLEFFKNNPKGTRVEAANALGDITEDGVKFVIGKLQQKGLLKRVGGRKHGEWQVLI